jgi:hypothetical protein
MSKEKFYYLAIWSALELDHSVTKILDSSVHPPMIGQVGLEIDFWPADDLFQVWPIFFVTERLRSILKSKSKFAEKIEFSKTVSVKKGQNFVALYPDSVLPDFYWKIDISGIPGVDDFGLWNRMCLVVSEKALKLLRNNHVTHAEADLIEGDIDGYFQSDRKNFWLKKDLKFTREE